MNSCTSDLPNTCAARLNKDKETEEEGTQKIVKMEIRSAGTKKKSRRPNCSSGYRFPGVALPDTVYEYLTYIHIIHPLPPGRITVLASVTIHL